MKSNMDFGKTFGEVMLATFLVCCVLSVKTDSFDLLQAVMCSLYHQMLNTLMKLRWTRI